MAKRLTVFVAVFAALLSVTLSVQADYEYNWTGAGGSVTEYKYWNYTNWSCRAGTTKDPASGFLGDTNYSPTKLYILNDAINDSQTSHPINFDNQLLGNAVIELNIGQAGNTNTATVNRNTGHLYIGSGKTLNISTGGTFEFYPNSAEHSLHIQNGGKINLNDGALTVKMRSNTKFNIDNGGTFNMTGGTLSSTCPINVAGKMTVSGGTFSFTNNITVKTGGDFRYTAGANITIPSSTTFSVDGGTFEFDNSNAQLQVLGDINILSGDFTVTKSSAFRIGDYAKGTVNIKGATSTVTVKSPTYMGVGANSNYIGTINQEAGSASFSNVLALGWGNYVTGVYNLSGGTLTTTGITGLWNANPNGASEFNVTGGSANFNYTGETVAGSFIIGLYTDHNKTYDNKYYVANKFNLCSGTVNSKGAFVIQYDGILNVTNTIGTGTNAQTYAGDGVLNASGIIINTSGELNLSSGTINLGSGGITHTDISGASDNSYTINLSGGTFGNYKADETSDPNWSTSLNATVAANSVVTFAPSEGNSITWNGVLSGDGGIVVDGDGTLSLGGSNTFSGGTTVNNGTLTLTHTGGKGTLAAGKAVTVNGPNSVLAGHGDILGYDNGAIGSLTLTNGGTFKNDYVSGSGDRHITINNDVYMNNGIIVAEGPGHDQVGNFNIDNAIHVTGGTENAINATKFNLRNRTDSSGNFEVASNANLTIKSTIIGYNLTKTGPGTLTFDYDSNNFVDNAIGVNVIINEGTVVLSKSVNGNNRFANNKEVTVNSGGMLRCDAGDSIGYGSNSKTFNLYGGTLHLNGFNESVSNTTVNLKGGYITSTGTTANNAFGVQNGTSFHAEAEANATAPTVSTISAPVTLRNSESFNVTVDNNAKLVFSGSIMDGYGLENGSIITKLGPGVLVFEGANTYTVGTIISAGTLVLTENGTLGTGPVTDNGTLEFNYSENKNIHNVISGNGMIDKQGTNTVYLNGKVSDYTGDMNIDGGVLSVLMNGTNTSLKVTKLSGNGNLELRLASGNGNTTLPNLTNNGFTGVISLVESGGSNGNKIDTGSKSFEGFTFNVNSGTTIYVDSEAFGANVNLSGTGNNEGYGALRLHKNMTGNITVMANNPVLGIDRTAVTVSGNIASGANSGETTLVIKSVVNDNGKGTFTGNIADNIVDETTISTLGIKIASGTHTFASGEGKSLTYTGATTVDPGATLKLSGANANLLNSSSAIVNGTLDVTGYTGSTAMQLNSLTGSGIVNIGSNALTLNNNTEADSIFSGAINGTSGLTKTGTGTLTLSGANTYTGMTTVSAGVLKLTGDAVVANGPVSVGANGTLEYNIGNGQTKLLSISEINKIVSTGQVIKTGDGTLQLYTDAANMIDVQSLTVSSGRVDIKEYFYGKLIVDSEGTFSPGNSVGSLTIGDGTYGGGFILNEAGAELLMEIGGSAASANDVLIVEGDITLVDGSVITLVNNSNLGLGESFTAILSAENSANLDILGHIQTTDFTDLKYVEINDATHGTVYAITGRTLNANEVPEPSTWALLILGAAGLLYWRKKKNA